jgi:putative tryptophan/tyrosine transport system substrate-binding protein
MNPDRRTLCAGTLGALAIPQLGVAQPSPRMRRIGYLSLTKADAEVAQLGAKLSRESLWRRGWEYGKNLLIEYRYAEGDVARLDTLAAELAGSGVELIYAVLNSATLAARRATQTIPIVMVGGTFPVEVGLVQSLARPGGNVTGTAVEVVGLYARTFQFMRELAPRRAHIAFLTVPAGPGFEQFTQMVRGDTLRAAQALGMTIQFIEVKATEDLAGALEQIAASRAELLFVVNSGLLEPRMREITGFAIRNRILSAASFTLFASVDGAMYYGSNLQDIIDRSTSFVDRILRGAKPGDLPVELPTKFDLILNLKTLRAIGISVPRNVLLQASEVIE